MLTHNLKGLYRPLPAMPTDSLQARAILISAAVLLLCTPQTRHHCRDLPVWFCSNGGGADPNGGCGSDPNAPGFSAWAGGAAMTPTVCSVLCSGQKYFGIEVGYQCYCGNVLGKEATEVHEKECNSRCTGEQNLDSNCGGLVGSPGNYEGRISVYQA